MLEIDKVVRTCLPDEAQRLHVINKTDDVYYDYWYEDDAEFHYIIVDSVCYRLKYNKVGPNQLSFSGEAVELENNDKEFID